VLVDRIVELSQALWLLAFGFYALDVARLVAPGRLLLRETSGGRFAPVLAAFPFELAKKELYVAGILVPWRAVLTARWAADVDPRAVTLAQADDALHGLLPFRLVGTFNFILLFVVGPVLTSIVGLGGALLIVAPLLYPINLLTGIYLLKRRNRFGLARGQAAWMLADALLCPPYGANWVKRIARLLPELPALTQIQDRLAAADLERVSSVIALRQAHADDGGVR